MITFAGISLYIIDKTRFKMFGGESISFILAPVLLWILYFVIGKPIFEYDSDGETLNFRNKHLIPFLGKEKIDEFPKYKLISYDILNALFFKKLFVTISSKKSKSITLRYDISYLKKSKIKDLKISLNKVIKNNQQNRAGQTQEE